MQEVLALIRHHGDWFYLITFIWTALEGETFVIFAALAAQRGLLNIWPLFTAAWLGSFFGDQVFFLLGRVYGKRLLARFPRLKPKADRALRALEKYATYFILSYRFMYGVRNVSGIAVGLSGLSWKRFAALNFLAAFIWASAFCGVGYFFGDVVQRLGRRRKEIVEYSIRELMLLVLGIFAIIIISRLVSLRLQAKRAEQKGDERHSS